jgi:hypothetical protein
METEAANRRALRQITEAQGSKVVSDHAQRAGWLVFFIPDRMWRQVFATSYGQHVGIGTRGFPDMVLVSATGRLLFRELKREGKRNDLSEHQVRWRDALIAAGADWDLWTPSDLDAKVIPTLWATSPSPQSST